MAKKTDTTIHGTEKEFIDLFQRKCRSLSAWQAWSYIIDSIAIALSNAFDPDVKRREKREKEWQQCIDYLGGQDVSAEALSVIVTALDQNPDQDFLGKMFMELGLGSHWHGQFFTPYNIAKAMAEMSIDGQVLKQIDEKGWASVNDPACGAGATLIGAVSAFKKHEIDFQNHVCFVANDIDRTTAQMCYIQLSLLGCAGYVAVTNTLSDPVTGPVLFPSEGENQEFWYIPMWWNDIWALRRLFNRGDRHE